VVVLDCTTSVAADPAGGERITPERATFASGHIPGAQFVDLQGELSDQSQRLHFMLPSATRFAQAMERFGVRAGTRVVTYSTGNPWWATRVWWMLRVFGFENAAVLNGGFAKWKREGRPLETGPGSPRPKGSFPVPVPRALIADKSDVLRAIGNDTVCMLNALPPPTFRGEVPSAYGRAGHIAGSLNLPGISLIDPETNRFRDADAIRAAFQAVGANDRKIVSYCGGGITATLLAFAAALIGRDDVIVYDGSMQEWAADESLPMATGA
jgi:thiosulfate/3-mercaptopyruvate sulfurtransferase